MRLADGSKSWIFSSFFSGVFLLILSIIQIQSNVGYVLLLSSVFLFILTVFFLMFFRDPDRFIGKGLVACADGKIREISEINDKDVGNCICISTFMNIQNVHVNRMPIEGKIKKIHHKNGFHLPAFRKESEKNERTIIIVDSKIGKIKIIQIAGTLARRIITYIKKDEEIKKGKRIGIIRLGSRVDVYLPKKFIKNICVKKGEKVKAGVDTLAEIND